MKNRNIPFLSFVLKMLMLLMVFAVLGCNPYKDVKVESFKFSSFELESTSRASMIFTVEIDNPLDTPISLLAIDGTLLKDYSSFANITLDEEVVVPANMIEFVMVKVNIVLIDPMSLLSMGLNIGSWDLADFRTNARVTLKLGTRGSRTFKFEDVPLERMVNSFK